MGRRRPRTPMRNLAEYAALRTVCGFLQCFSIEQNLRTAAGVGSFFHRRVPARSRRAIDNLQRSFPEWSPERCADVAERSLQNMFKIFMVDALVTPRLITETSWPRYIRIRQLGRAIDRLIRNEPTIFITGHCGNWELLGYTMAVLGYPLAALARPLDNPYINRWLLSMREARGMQIITKWGATPVLQDLLRNRGRVAFIADQNAGDQGLFVPFFGRLASTYKSIALLAMRYEVAIVAGHARRVDGGLQYEIDVTDAIEPADWADQEDPVFYITARFNRAIEQMIRRAPEQYLWIHRRWKSRPRFERQGRAVPVKLIEKMRQLPWMTEDEIQRVVEDSSRASAAVRGGEHIDRAR